MASYDFKKTENLRHTDEYKARLNDYSGLQDEYDPTTELGCKRIKELTAFENKVLPGGDSTLLGQIAIHSKIDKKTCEFANYGHIYKKIDVVRQKRDQKV